MEQFHIGQGAVYAVGTHTHHHRPAGGVFLYGIENQAFLFVGQSGRFARRTQGYQEIDSRLHLALRSGDKGLYVNLTVAERGEHGCPTALKQGVHYAKRV